MEFLRLSRITLMASNALDETSLEVLDEDGST